MESDECRVENRRSCTLHSAFLILHSPLLLSPRMRLDSFIVKVRAIPMGGADCSLPMVWARRNQVRVSAFVTYTDSETWAGNVSTQNEERRMKNEGQWAAFGSSVLHSPFLVPHLNVMGMTSNGFTLADPNDRDIPGTRNAPIVLSWRPRTIVKSPQVAAESCYTGAIRRWACH
jgi:hypothetical protein